MEDGIPVRVNRDSNGRFVDGTARIYYDVGFKRGFRWIDLPTADERRRNISLATKGKKKPTLSIKYKRDGNPNWKGDKIKETSARGRAEHWFKPKPCEVCGARAEIHHKDGNPYNNSEDNIEWLCRRHHMKKDGREDPAKCPEARKKISDFARSRLRDSHGRFL